ncbi:tetratricopeptide repeat protein [Erythrobacter sp. SD-21]|uniref:SPOR domain-containing protein n=1 Tax=Erythrobacter sp. SD-21 TaxID=161528 RepID=UPI00030F918B|nr:tetratricopeptide repeat protein [Erythrobacter sp. SD-21]
MQKHVWLKSVATIALTIGTATSLAGTAHAQAVTDQTLSDLRVERVGTCTTLTVEFNIRLQILSYYPSRPGRELYIRVRPLDPSANLAARDALRPPGSLPELRSIEYDGTDPGGPLVSLYFQQDMQFEVEGGPRPDSLVIKLFQPGEDRACSLAQAPAASTVVATPGPGPAVTVAAEPDIPPGRFVVNAISAPGSIGELSREQRAAIDDRVAYDSPVDREGEEWHRLRLGFYETKEEADAAAASLADLFPGAFAIEVSPDEREEAIATRMPIAPPADVSLAGGEAGIPPGLYIVNALSSPAELGDLSPEQQGAISGRVAYDSVVERDGEEWHRLRVGFFETKEQAEAAAAQLEEVFPAAWTLRISPEERAEGIAARMDTGELIVSRTTRPSIVASPEQSAEVDRLILEAEAAIALGNNDRAIQLLTNARRLPEAQNTPRAIELLGLTRERKQQVAQAQAEYEEYLRRYPEGEDAERVRQRLAALSGPVQTAELREAEGGNPAAWTWDVRGSFSQFYYRDQSRTRFVDAAVPEEDPDEDDQVNLNQLLTSADIAIMAGNDRGQFEARASGSYVWNFRSGGRDLKAITALYVGASDARSGIQSRFGRQTRNSGGVFGRFDGTWVGWQADEKVKVNAVAGFPVLTSRQTRILDERRFYGASIDYGERSDAVQATAYFLNQEARGGFVDRRSIGAELRLRKDRFNAFGLLDYDIHHEEVNLALATLAYTAEDGSNLSMTADYRRSPLLTTSNALIGQIGVIDALPFTDLRDLLRFYTEDEIYRIARDRTLVTKSLTTAYSRPITEKLQANFDFTLTETSGSPLIPATDGTQEIPALASTGTEYYFGAQVVGTGFLWDNDIYILSGRYADTQRSHSYTVDFNARVPLTDKVRLTPRLRYGRREDRISQTTYEQFQPSLRVNIYPFRHGEIELEAGMNFASQRIRDLMGVSTFDETGVIFTAGYRLDF